MPRGLIYAIDDARGEYSTLKSYLKAAGYDVSVAVGARDLSVNYDIDLNEVKDPAELSKSYDLYAIVGGFKMYYFVTNKKPPIKKLDISIDKNKLEILTKASKESGGVIIAPLAVPAYLAKLGLLKGLRATVYPVTDLIQILKENEVKYTNNSIEFDNKIITIKEVTKISEKEFAEVLREGT